MKSIDFDQPFARAAAMRAKGIGLCAFLISLAAVQRGLRVTFLFDPGDYSERFAKTGFPGHRGEIFIVDDGKNEHAFSRSMGDLNDPERAHFADDKYLSKILLAGAGLKVPQGIMVSGEEDLIALKHLDTLTDRRLVVKPVSGSLSANVSVGLSGEEVKFQLKRLKYRKVIVEEFIPGREYRLTVVGDRCVAVSWRMKPCVVGDGVSSVSELISGLEIGLRSNNPHWGGFINRNDMILLLQKQGYRLQDVLQKGTNLQLTETADGVVHQDVTDNFDQSIKDKAVKAAKVFGLVNCGIDLIVEKDGVANFIEVNQRSYIGQHSFPGVGTGRGNDVAEAIIDYYFPHTKSWKRSNEFLYDFCAVKDAMNSGSIAKCELPFFGADDIVKRKFIKGKTAERDFFALGNLSRMNGVYFFGIQLSAGVYEVCLKGSKVAIENLTRCLRQLRDATGTDITF